MLQQLIASPHLFWLSLGGLLLAAELLGAITCTACSITPVTGFTGS